MSEGHDGDVVVSPSHPSLLSLPFLHHYNRAHGNAWIEIDISAGTDDDREFMLIPDHYGLRSASGVGGKPRSWILEGCRAKPRGEEGIPTGGSGKIGDHTWVVLSEHKQDSSLALTHCSTAAWEIKHESLRESKVSNEITDYHQEPMNAYRYFRIVNTGNNSCGNRCVHVIDH